MKNLKAFVDRENQYSAIFGARALDLANAADRQKIARQIDSFRYWACLLSQPGGSFQQ